MDTNKDAIQIDWEKKVDEKFEELLSVYTSSRHRKKVDIIAKAFNFARQAHKGVRRLSGEPYIMHPIAVALIACKEIGLGSTSICAALLHDVVEDTDYTTEDIENMFGPKIAQIVEGLTKISGVNSIAIQAYETLMSRGQLGRLGYLRLMALYCQKWDIINANRISARYAKIYGI